MKIIGLLVCFLFAFSLASASTSDNIQLDVFSGSNAYWVALAVRNAGVDTASVQIQESGSSTWDSLTYVTGWGYWTTSSTKIVKFPISVRLTSTDGRQLTIPNIISSGKTGLVSTGVQYVPGTSPSTGAPTSAPTAPPTCPTNTPKPTEIPATAAPSTQAPTSAPTTQRPTSAPTTQRPTSAPSTRAPTSAPTTKAPTSAPTRAPTSAPTRSPTSAPTRAPTSAPTRAPTSAPTTKAPTSAPTRAPTSAPTRAPTSAPTTKAPTTKPGGSGCNGPMKLMVPLYSYPGAQWDTVAASGRVVPTLAIINPSSGPGSGAPSSTWVTYMNKLANAGVEMTGYVHTSYGSRSISTVKKEIDIYATHFPLLTGIFLDEVSADQSKVAYYQELYDYIMGMPGWKYDILNPGAVPVAGYTSAGTQIVTYESNTAGFASSRDPAYATCDKKDMFAMITYGASSSQMQSAISAAKSKGYYGWVYVTSTGASGGTYNSLPSYYADMARHIASLN